MGLVGAMPCPSFLLLLQSGTDVVLGWVCTTSTAQQLQQLVFPSLRPNSGFPGGQCVPALSTATGCVLITLKNMEMCKRLFISLLLIKCLQCCLGRSGLFDTARMLVFLEQPSVQSAVKNWFLTAQSHFSS